MTIQTTSYFPFQPQRGKPEKFIVHYVLRKNDGLSGESQEMQIAEQMIEKWKKNVIDDELNAGFGRWK